VIPASHPLSLAKKSLGVPLPFVILVDCKVEHFRLIPLGIFDLDAGYYFSSFRKDAPIVFGFGQYALACVLNRQFIPRVQEGGNHLSLFVRYCHGHFLALRSEDACLSPIARF
jgi:hypothetical protein